MTRGVGLRFGKLATWMDKVESGYFATTADPSTTLRSGRDDKGRGLRFGRLATWMDKVESGYFATTADPSTTLRSGRDDKGRAATFRKVGDLDGQSYERLLCQKR
jgi:hypothetical protein